MYWDGTLAGYEEMVTGECNCVCHREKFKGKEKKQCGHCHHMRYPEEENNSTKE